MTPNAESDLAPRLLRLVNGYQLTQLIYVAAKLRIADILTVEAMHVDELAKITGTHGPSLYRLLRCLAAYGVFVEPVDRHFALTPLSTCLREDSPNSIRSTVLMRGYDYYRTWGELLFSIETGQPSFPRVFGMSNWDYRQSNPEANARFNSFVAEIARRRAASLRNILFPEEGTVVDVGGGDGTLLISILQRYPRLRGILFDRPQVIKDAASRLRAANVEERCLAVGGDFFKEVPSGGTLYILSAVLHDWNDDLAANILRTCRKELNDATLFIIERLLPESTSTSQSFLSDLDMLVNTGGRERDRDSWRVLLETTAFHLEEIMPTESEFYVLRARGF
jgi:hypothetical protein